MDQRSQPRTKTSSSGAYEHCWKSARLLAHVTVFIPVADFQPKADFVFHQGQFFYISDNEESDIEILTGDLGHGAHYTNQNLVLGGKSTTNTSGLPVDVTTTMYEYRLDWLEDRTEFYLNGELQTTLKDNVPNTAGAWLWNNWR